MPDPTDNADPADKAERHDPTEPTDRAEPTDPTLSTDPTEPTLKADPTDPIDSTDPWLATDRNESSDQRERAPTPAILTREARRRVGWYQRGSGRSMFQWRPLEISQAVSSPSLGMTVTRLTIRWPPSKSP
jgi:hypothetical protein